MKIYVVGSSRDKFLQLDNIREKFLIDQKHEGDNIDFLNPWYCELTGLYYLWKHCDDEIVGLEHYRTYFWKDGHPINEEQIKEELKNGDVICSGWKMPNPFHGGKTVREEFLKVMREDYKPFLEKLEQTNKEFYSYFNQYLDSDEFICCNMMITKKENLNEYMDFLFDVILNFNEISKPTRFNYRREGWISEFMFGAWLNYKNKNKVFVNINKLVKNLDRTEFYITNPSERVRT